MKDRIYKKIPLIYWSVVLLDCFFLHFNLPYIAIAETLPVPLLLLYMMMKDRNIEKPTGKLVFYIGLIFAFMGDLLQIIDDNDTLLKGTIIVFFLMNIAYSFSFYRLNTSLLKNIRVILITLILLVGILCGFVYFIGEEMGDFKLPVIIYSSMFAIMICFAINVTGNPRYRAIAFRYMIPGVFAFLGMHILIGLNIFHYHHNKDIYMIVMIFESLAQYLLVRAMMKIYGRTVIQIT